MLVENSSRESAGTHKGNERVDADGEEQDAKADAGVARVALRASPDHHAPVN